MRGANYPNKKGEHLAKPIMITKGTCGKVYRVYN